MKTGWRREDGYRFRVAWEAQGGLGTSEETWNAQGGMGTHEEAWERPRRPGTLEETHWERTGTRREDREHREQGRYNARKERHRELSGTYGDVTEAGGN